MRAVGLFVVCPNWVLQTADIGEEPLKVDSFSSRPNNLQTRQMPKEYIYDHSDDDALLESSDEVAGVDSETWTSNDTPPANHSGERAYRQQSIDRAEPQRRAVDVWQMALNDLALSMPAPTYETWVRDTSVLGYEDGEFVIGVPHAYARDWLEQHLLEPLAETFSKMLQRPSARLQGTSEPLSFSFERATNRHRNH